MTREEQVQAALAEMGIESPEARSEESEPTEEHSLESSFDATEEEGSEVKQGTRQTRGPQQASSSADEVLAKAKIAAAQAERKAGHNLSREVPVSAFVHLLGLATSTQVEVIENRLEIITNRLNALNLRVERLNTLLEETQNQAILERLDYQISDIKSILKKVLPGIVTTIVEEPVVPSAQPTPTILTSDSHAEPEHPDYQDDKTFQRKEAKRVRKELSASNTKGS